MRFAGRCGFKAEKMQRWTILLLLLCSFSGKLGALEETPKVLVQAAQCLSVKSYLALSNSKILSLGYTIDQDSYPGKKVLYVVNYQGSSRSKGFVYTIFLTTVKSKEVYNLQNNAKFVRTKDGIDFVEPPLGGTWTQQHIEAAVMRIEQSPVFLIPSESLLAPPNSIRCESYADQR